MWEAGFWGPVGGSALILEAVIDYAVSLPQSVIAAVMAIPEATEATHDYSGLIAMIGFLLAFVRTKAGA